MVLKRIYIFGALLKIIHAQPLPHPTNYRLDKCIQNFPEFQLCIGWGEGELQDILYTVLWGHPEITENHEYWSAVPRTFTRDINLSSYKAKPKLVC